MLRYLWDCHRVDWVARDFLEIETVEQAGNRNPDIHLADFPANTDTPTYADTSQISTSLVHESAREERLTWSKGPVAFQRVFLLAI